jgi:hypothetical protein
MSNDEKNPFGERPETQTRLDQMKEQGFVMVVTKAFGPEGEDLIAHEGPLFSGEPGVEIRVEQGDLVDDVILSPFYGDPSKITEVEFVEGEPCKLSVPSTGTRLEEVPGMRTEEGGRYFAVYLTEKLDEGELIAINNIWGNTESQFMGEGELLHHYAEIEMSEAEEEDSD